MIIDDLNWLLKNGYIVSFNSKYGYSMDGKDYYVYCNISKNMESETHGNKEIKKVLEYNLSSLEWFEDDGIKKMEEEINRIVSGIKQNQDLEQFFFSLDKK